MKNRLGLGVSCAVVVFCIISALLLFCTQLWAQRLDDRSSSPSSQSLSHQSSYAETGTLWSSIGRFVDIFSTDDNLFAQIEKNGVETFSADMNKDKIVSSMVDESFLLPTRAQCSVLDSDKLDCFPESLTPSLEDCRARVCCLDNSTAKKDSPKCYYSQVTDGYGLVSVSPMKYGNSTIGLNATLKRVGNSPYPKDVKVLQLLVFYETKFRVRFKIFDPAKVRYEVPIQLNDQGTYTPEEDADYRVSIGKNLFSITITRKSDGQILFDSAGMVPLIFADQYLQIGSKLSSPYIYGLGEHRGGFPLNTTWQKMFFWTADQPPEEDKNLYGSHPFYLNLEPSGKAHGVFLLNSNAMQMELSPYNRTGSITYRVLGGILDFFVFSGPSPDEVTSQYVSLVGYPFMPPLWALGFHLCRHNYGSSRELWKVIQRNRMAKMPYDAQWNDLDYSVGGKMWTWNKQTYSNLSGIIDNLHKYGQHNVIIVDPTVSSTQSKGTYPPFDLGVKLDVFIKNASGQLLIGKLWSGDGVFVDFFNANALDYWFHFINQFHSVLSFDGLWIDMNEPTNFANGSLSGCTNDTLDNPPFMPPVGISQGSLFGKTVCPSALQQFSSHYNLHNLFGWSESMLTSQTLRFVLMKRSMVISRSTFPGSGSFTGHWSGDNLSSFRDMRYSIAEILNFNIFGIPLMGADICGFRGNTTRELCIRWMQLGAFYPFMRNHAEINTVPQDPGWFDIEAQTIMREALELRYSLLPYLYTRFYLSHTTGAPVVRPLFFDYPGTESIDQQFLWGSEILVSPVLEEGAISVKAYIPKGLWFDLQTFTELKVTGGKFYTLPAPLDKINVHVKGGSIIPMVAPAVTTTLVRQGKIELLVVPDATFSAVGQLYWDDGESLKPVMHSLYSLVDFALNKTTVRSEVQAKSYSPVMLGKVTVLGIASAPLYITMNDQLVDFFYDYSTRMLRVSDLSVDLLTPFELIWH